MPYTPTDPPFLIDEEVNELGKWIRDELTRLGKAFDAPSISQYEVLHVEPTKPREGMIVVADGSDWDPGEGAGQYMYIGGVWVFQRSGPEPNSYGIMTDGTTAAPAEVANDTFKFRGEGITPVTQNDDGTHGDNVNLRLTPTTLTLTAPALGDAIPFGDVSDSNNPKKMTPQTLLDLIGTLTTEASPDFAADFLALYDASGVVAKKVALSHFSTKTLISTTALTGSSVDITVPAGYTDLQLRLKAADTSVGALIRIRFSEDAGSSYLTQTGALFSDSFETIANAVDNFAFSPYSAAAGIFWGVMDLFDYLSAIDKFTREQYVLEAAGASSAAAGSRVLNSSAAINEINVNMASGTFTGSVELWGIR